ncbi:MAG: ABC transporter ATP-binding protein [Amphiplicatus sp.]
MTRVELANVTFDYPLFEVTQRSLKVTLMNYFRGEGGKGPHVRAVRDVSFTLEDGERLGLVGANGSGKSTLLRLIGGLAHPTAGSVRTEGRVVSLIDKGLGVNQEFAGSENIELPLRFLGATTEEIRAARQDVRDFADLGPFFDLPVRRYSEGMKARLSFALSTAVHADVLILDEWLSAGDAQFVQRAEARLNAYLEQIKVVVLASHSLELLRSVCSRVAWMDKGKLVEIGEPDRVIDHYLEAYAEAKPGLAAE